MRRVRVFLRLRVMAGNRRTELSYARASTLLEIENVLISLLEFGQRGEFTAGDTDGLTLWLRNNL